MQDLIVPPLPEGAADAAVAVVRPTTVDNSSMVGATATIKTASIPLPWTTATAPC